MSMMRSSALLITSLLLLVGLAAGRGECNPQASDRAYARYMRAHYYRDMAHEQHGWLGGAWIAVGEGCTVLSIQTADRWPKESREEFKTGAIGRDLCTYGFNAVSFNGWEEPLTCTKPHKRGAK